MVRVAIPPSSCNQKCVRLKRRYSSLDPLPKPVLRAGILLNCKMYLKLFWRLIHTCLFYSREKQLIFSQSSSVRISGSISNCESIPGTMCLRTFFLVPGYLTSHSLCHRQDLYTVFHSHCSLASWTIVSLSLHFSPLQTPRTRHLSHPRHTNICIIDKITLSEQTTPDTLCVYGLTLQDTVGKEMEHSIDLAYTSTFNSLSSKLKWVLCGISVTLNAGSTGTDKITLSTPKLLAQAFPLQPKNCTWEPKWI